jgi:hypothetical protein
MEAKTNYTSIDIAKFCFALLIMFSHISSSLVYAGNYLDFFFSLYVFGVPFFFTISSFFFFKSVVFNGELKDKNYEKYKKFSKRILIMYGLWSLIYAVFVVTEWVINGFVIADVLKYLHQSFVFSTYQTIWFLPALWVGLSITYFVLLKFGIKTLFISSIIFYLFGALGYSYFPLIEKNHLLFQMYTNYNDIFITLRNGFFNGFPFAAIGVFLVLSKNMDFKENLISIFLFVFVIFESFMIKYFVKGFGIDFGLFLLPFTFFFIKTLIKIDFKEFKFLKTARDLSILIFLSQRIFITAIPNLFKGTLFFEMISDNALIGFTYVIVSTLTVSFLIIKYRNNIRLFKFLS